MAEIGLTVLMAVFMFALAQDARQEVNHVWFGF